MKHSTSQENHLEAPPSHLLKTVHPGWLPVFEHARVADALTRLDAYLQDRLDSGATIFPRRVFRALEILGPDDVQVIILGQDPYHGPGQAQGLAFSVPDSCPAPPSLRNMFKELALEYPDRPLRRRHELSDWVEQGVLLLNTCLTVEQANPGSHARKGWETVTDALLQAVAGSDRPKVFMLWGNHAQAKQALLEQHGRTLKILCANHPSPLSARRAPRPFIGCGHFEQANAWLSAMGGKPINWVGTHSIVAFP